MRVRGFEKVSKYESEDIIMPKRGSQKSAGYDFYMPQEEILKANDIIKIKTKIKAYMDENEFLSVHIRSSLGIKGISVLNTVGIIDSDYYNNEKNEGEIIVFLKNNTNEDIVLEKDSRVVQGIFQKYLTIDNDQELTTRSGGFGSTNNI